MRHLAWLAALLAVSACSSGSGQSASLVLVNHYWQHVNVEAVVTNSADCGSRGQGYVSTEHFVMTKDQKYTVVAPHGEAICWRHDPNPDNPVKGLWSGWSRAVLFPGQSTETDL